MVKIQDFFDNIYIINLKKRTDRLCHIKQELDKINCDIYTIYEAIDGSTLNVNTKIKKGNYALCLTTKNILKEAKEKKFEKILILEDDVIFKDKFNENFNNTIEHLPDDWDLFYMGANHMKPKIEYNDKIDKLTYSYAAHFLGVKNTIYDVIIENIDRGEIENDVLYANLQSYYNAYCSKKQHVKQLASFSDIELRNVNYDFIFEK